MPTDPKPTETRELALNQEEAADLLRLLESAMRESRVEVHRTHTPEFRAGVQHEGAVIRGLLEKVRTLQF